ncbi:hypothetical protein RRF57_003114 [Xylaria bambusicola]|uniref:Uncharacterized protein n=1 Tax=Xylaria bambusicola TaxID=326684 RepID=A0AAN7UE78_9PEZI
MNIPNRPPMPKPITPDIADFPKQDSIIAFIYKPGLASANVDAALRERRTYGFDIGVIGVVCPPRRRRGADSG